MNFGDAISALKAGKKVSRDGWSQLSLGKEGEQPIIFWSSIDHPLQVYHPTAGEMLADDWQELA